MTSYIFQGGSYIFEFKNFSDLHVCREFVGKPRFKIISNPCLLKL